jgi:hypothetical protein
MNEILQKRIEEAAEQYSVSWRKNPDGSESKEMFPVAAERSFKAGATFALQNQWISVDEALPPIREKGTENRSWSDWVLIITHEGAAFVDCYAFHRREWLNNGNDVTHWMPIPEMKGDEE